MSQLYMEIGQGRAHTATSVHRFYYVAQEAKASRRAETKKDQHHSGRVTGKVLSATRALVYDRF